MSIGVFWFRVGADLADSRSFGPLPDKIRWLSEWVTGVRSCYDEGKRTAETLTMDYHRGAGVEVPFLNPNLIIFVLLQPKIN